MSDVAFNARFRITENRNKKHEKSPEQNLAIDFTPDQAMAAANWLMTAAENAEREGTKVRVYRGLDDFEEVTGFTLWGGMWGTSGKISPLKHTTAAETDLF
jgi:hypothetical protein